MTTYEGMFLLDNKAMAEDWGDSLDQVVDLVRKAGGTLASARRWDERKLAYRINGRQRGTYVLTYFESDGAGVDSLATEVRLSPLVLRHVVVSRTETPEEELAVGIQREIPEPEPTPAPEPEPTPAPEPESESESEPESEPESESAPESEPEPDQTQEEEEVVS